MTISEEHVGRSPSCAWLLSLHPLRSASSSTLELFLKSSDYSRIPGCDTFEVVLKNGLIDYA